MTVSLSDDERTVVEEFIDRVAELDLSWTVDGNGWIRTGDVLKHGTIHCFPTDARYAFDAEVVTGMPHRMEPVSLEQLGKYYGFTRNVWNAIWWAAYNTPSHDPELRKCMIEALKAQVA